MILHGCVSPYLVEWGGRCRCKPSCQQLLLEPEFDLIFDRLEKFGQIPAETVLIMKQMTVLKQEVQACVGLGIQAIEAQLAENYKKTGTAAKVILNWLNNWLLNIPS